MTDQQRKMDHPSIWRLVSGSGRTIRQAAPRRPKPSGPAGENKPKEEKSPAEEKKPEEEDSAAKAAKTAEFTAEQDAAILKMKLEEGKSWKEIATALDKHPGQVKGRFKVIKPSEEAGAAASREEEEPAQDRKSKVVSQPKKERQKQMRDKQTQTYPHPQPHPHPHPHPQTKTSETSKKSRTEKSVRIAEPSSSKISPTFMEPDDLFDREDLEIINRLLEWDQDEMWLRVASRFYDQTGRRVHEDDIKDKVLGESTYDPYHLKGRV